MEPVGTQPASTHHRALTGLHGVVATVVAALAAPVAGQLGFVVALGIQRLLTGSEGSLGWSGAMPPLWIIALTTVLVQATLALVALCTPMVARVSWRNALGFRRPAWPLVLAAPVGAIALGPFGDLLMQGVALLIQRFDPSWQSGSIEMILGIARNHPLWATIPLIAFLPGVAEELLFRGMLQRALGSSWWAVLCAGIAFAAFHFDPVHMAGVFPIGLYLGFLLKRSGSIWVPIAAHAGNNAFSLVAANLDVFDVGYGSDHPTPVSWVVIGLIVAMLVIAWVVPRTREPEREQERGLAS